MKDEMAETSHSVDNKLLNAIVNKQIILFYN